MKEFTKGKRYQCTIVSIDIEEWMNLVKESELEIWSLQTSSCQRNPTANHQLFLCPTR